MLHSVFIGLHALAGVVALVAGGFALTRGRFFAIYLWAMVAMLGFLVLAVAAQWPVLTGPTRFLFGALGALAVVMCARAWLAGRLRPVAPAPPPAAYVRHVGFTLVGLLDAFAVITVLNAGAPGWSVAAVGVALAAAGHFAIDAAEHRLRARHLPGVSPRYVA
ncbi:MAG: hypothetical protein M3P48_01340 [Actinomycetota bacterium]|nr:hypothetical protein [Actinomycetota bacterium]